MGFSLEMAILNPDIAQKTDAELKQLLIQSGVWSDTTGVNKAKMLENLEKPIKNNNLEEE